MAKKRPHGKSVDEFVDDAVYRVTKPMQRAPAWLQNLLGGILAGPVIGLVAGFMLLFAGVFLILGWSVSFGPLIDQHRYAAFTGSATGKIVDSWMALSFDPRDMPKDKLRWFGYAKITGCAVVEYPGDFSAPLRRAFCGSRFDFGEDFAAIDFKTMAPDVPFAFARDAKGFAIQQLRASADAVHWLKSHPPYSTFMLGKPPAPTALDALREQFDQPTEIALASWSTPIPDFPLALDPAHPEQAMPAKYVEQRRGTFWYGGFVFAAIFFAIGLTVWTFGMGFLFGGLSKPVFWLATLTPLLGLPWASDGLPKLIRYVNHDWGEIATDLVSDLSKGTRLDAFDPEDARLANGERIEIYADRGRYVDTFGKIPFRKPPQMVSTTQAMGALVDQTSAYVAALDSTAKASLFIRLRGLDEANLKHTQSLFFNAAQEVLKDANANAQAHAAAKKFLLFASGGHYSEDQLEATEVAPNTTP